MQKSGVYRKKINNIDVYQKKSEEQYATTKGILEISAPIEALIAVLDDEVACREWVFNCLDRQKIKQVSPSSRIEYFVTKFPSPLKNRETYFLVTTKLNSNDKTSIFTINMISQNNYPTKPNMVLINKFNVKWILKSINETSTKVTYEIFIDPLLTSLIPKNTVNNEMVKSVYFTLSNLNKIVMKPKYLNKKFTNNEINILKNN